MHIAPLVDVLAPVSIGAVLGTNVSSDMLSSLNAELSAQAGGIVFGSSNDPYADMYHHFNKVVDLPLIETAKEIAATNIVIENKDAVRVIDSISELEKGIPVSMHEAILTYAPIRKMVEADTIFGFGYDYSQLPTEDRIGRLIDNGRAYFSPVKSEIEGDNPKHLTYEYFSDDPLFTPEELEDIHITRIWMGTFLEEEDNEDIDLTDYPEKQGKLE